MLNKQYKKELQAIHRGILKLQEKILIESTGRVEDKEYRYEMIKKLSAINKQLMQQLLHQITQRYSNEENQISERIRLFFEEEA